jgi:DNA polymerase-3 subunit beta
MSNTLEITVNRKALEQALASVAGATRSGSTQAILADVLLHAHAKGLRITATDTELAVTVDVEATVAIPGDCHVPHQGFLASVKSLPGEVVEIMVRGDKMTLLSGRTKYQQHAGPGSDFPAMAPFDEVTSLTTTAKDLRALFTGSAYAVAADDVRYGLNGLHLERVGPADAPRMRAVATNGHRLAAAEVPYSGTLGIKPRTLIPRSVPPLLAKLLPDTEDAVTVSFSDNAMRVTQPGIVLWFRALDGEFPDYMNVVPTGKQRNTVVVSAADIVGALRRARVVLGNHAKPMRMVWANDEIGMSATNQDGARFDDVVEASTETEHDRFEVGVQIAYMAEAVAALGAERVEITVSHSLAPLLFRPVGKAAPFAVVMPMRLD